MLITLQICIIVCTLLKFSIKDIYQTHGTSNFKTFQSGVVIGLYQSIVMNHIVSQDKTPWNVFWIFVTNYVTLIHLQYLLQIYLNTTSRDNIILQIAGFLCGGLMVLFKFTEY